MPKPYEGKDGIERDIAKLWYEFDFYRKDPKIRNAWSRWLALPSPHNATNIYVESCRWYAYLTGHFHIIKDALLCLLILLLVL